MAIKLHRCSGTWVKVNAHPCWRAQKALDEAGVEYELVLHSSLRFRRPEVEEMTGQRKLPIIEFEDGTLLTESTVIAERARAGTLVPEEKQATPEPPAAPAPEPPPTSVPEPPSAPSADVPPAAAPQPPPEPPEPPEREG
ncbi:MAG TPA: glutathione S-transferase N-terminal domain-containing protein [Gaiellales bacterium]|jgi:hypothetical protein|nr:glutathione S-transferase N-terminal domain-containing protein [Gaiellales bacterium]